MALAVGWPTGPGATGAEACGQLAGAEARGHGPSCSDSAAPRRTRLQGPAPGARCCGSWHQRGALTARRERCNSQEATQLTTRPRRLSLYEGAMYAVQSGMASRRALQRTNRRCILLPWGGGRSCSQEAGKGPGKSAEFRLCLFLAPWGAGGASSAGLGHLLSRGAAAPARLASHTTACTWAAGGLGGRQLPRSRGSMHAWLSKKGRGECAGAHKGTAHTVHLRPKMP